MYRCIEAEMDTEENVCAHRGCCVQARTRTIPCSLLGFKVCPFRSTSLTNAFKGQMRRNFCFPLVDFNIAPRINARFADPTIFLPVKGKSGVLSLNVSFRSFALPIAYRCPRRIERVTHSCLHFFSLQESRLSLVSSSLGR